MEGDAVSATIGVLVQNLIDLSKNEISLIRDLKKNADDLNETLGMIQGVLNDAQKKSITDEAVRKWLKLLQDVAFEANNVLDELHYQLLSNKRKSIQREEKKKKKTPSCFPSFSHYINQRQMALQIKEINTRFESIGNKAKKFGLQEIFTAAPDVAPASLETDSFTIDPIFIGRDDEVLKLVEMLTNCPTQEVVSILPVVGMGGMGKTTLVRNVFNHEKIKTHFQQHIWVHVSQDFDAVAIFEKILKNMQGSNIKDENRQGLLMKLQEALSNKTYILVLDDIWNQDSEKWNDFKNSWSGITSTKGNAILVTTRNKKVGTIVGTLDIHELKGLSEEECWSIIKGKALKGGDSPPIGLEVETIGRSIAKRCQGLPLAANVVGGVLHHKSHDQWLPIKEKWLSDDVGGDGNNITKILKLSFYNLPSQSLKNCFAYCSIFPKGAQINRAQLIELWMAEGFLQSAQTSDHMENEGNQFFNLLIQNSLLQVVDRDICGEIVYCNMHDLVHDLAVSINDEGMYRARYIHWSEVSSRIPKEQAKWLRTLLYNGQISDLIFSDFKSLHALTLMNYDVEELPNSIGKLVHLRNLDISETVIERLPESIGELYHLQTFRACIYLEKFPSTLKYLFNLRHLHMEYSLSIELPPHMGMLTLLQTLPFFKVGDEEGHRIEELGSLKNLKGELRIYNLENVNGEDESKKAYIFQKSDILRLVLSWNVGDGEIINDENVLNGLRPHPNLKSLDISGYRGVRFPSWTLKMEGLSKLVEIKLVRCYYCEEIPTFGHLPNLKSLYLGGFLGNVRCIGSSFYGMDKCSSNPHGVCKETIISVFPALERLELSGMEKLIEWEEVEIASGAQVKVFPRLQYLEINECKKLVNIYGTKLTSLVELIIVGLHELACIPDGLFDNSQSLSILKIRDCQKLKELPEWLFRNSQSLSLLEIRNCQKLKELPEDLQTLNSLKELRIEEWLQNAL